MITEKIPLKLEFSLFISVHSNSIKSVLEVLAIVVSIKNREVMREKRTRDKVLCKGLILKEKRGKCFAGKTLFRNNREKKLKMRWASITRQRLNDKHRDAFALNGVVLR